MSTASVDPERYDTFVPSTSRAEVLIRWVYSKFLFVLVRHIGLPLALS
jgi:hypothetical protein